MIMSLAALTLSACDKNKEGGEVPSPDPRIEIAAGLDEDVPAEGGDFTVSYTVTGPAEGGSVTAVAGNGEEWLNGFDTSESGKVSFTVSPNTSGEGREGEVLVVYEWSDGADSASLSVRQLGTSGEEPGPDPQDGPEIVLEESTVSISSDGGELSVAYTVENPAEDGVMAASVPEEIDWIAFINTDTEGLVTFTVISNPEDTLRTCDMTLTYSYTDENGLASEVTAQVEVRQEVLGDEPTGDPEISFGSSEYTFSGEAAQGEVTYTIENPRNTAVVGASADCDWITDISCTQDGTVTFSLAENTTGEQRSERLTLVYTIDIEGIGNVELCSGYTYITQNPILEQGEITDDVRSDISYTYEEIGGRYQVTYTVAADNPESMFFCDMINAQQSLDAGMSWYDLAYNELMRQKGIADIFGDSVESMANTGSYTSTFMPSNSEGLYVIAFAVDDNWNITSEVQYKEIVFE